MMLKLLNNEGIVTVALILFWNYAIFWAFAYIWISKTAYASKIAYFKVVYFSKLAVLKMWEYYPLMKNSKTDKFLRIMLVLKKGYFSKTVSYIRLFSRNKWFLSYELLKEFLLCIMTIIKNLVVHLLHMARSKFFLVKYSDFQQMTIFKKS